MIERLSGAVLILMIISCAGPASDTVAPAAERNSNSIVAFPDSFELGNIKVYSLFKDQLLANRGEGIDSQRIISNVYRRHQSLWDGCYAMIFGAENEAKFSTDTGMVGWNESLYRENKQAFDSIADRIVNQRIDSIFEYHIRRFKELSYPMPTARISLLFTPLTGIGFGGCSNDQFALELNNPDYESVYTLAKGVPHELYHLINEEASTQPADYTALDLSINEGLACYFTYTYFEGTISKYEAVENMSEDDWAFYEANEAAIFNQMAPYFNDTSGDNPLLRNEKYETFPAAPRSLHYWLGFRIVEEYLASHPEETIRELTGKSYEEIFTGSNYASFVAGLAADRK